LAAAAGAPGAEYAEDHILVKLKPEKLPLFAADSEADFLSAMISGLGLPPGARFEEPALGRLLRQQQPAGASASPSLPVDLSRFLFLYLPPGMSVRDAVQRLAGHGWVDYAEPDGIGSGGLVPNDPDFGQQWHHTNSAKPGADIHTPQAWDITQGSESVLVAVLDTGLAGQLHEFASRVVPGYRFANPNYNTNTVDDHGHGTMVAGVLCANANNGELGAGVDWGCRVMPIKVLNTSNLGYYSDWAQGIDYAVAHGAKVINLSAGGATTSTALANSISNAIARGAIFVTITHNDSSGTIRFPGSLPMCITVGATDQNDARASFSNYGPEIDLVAPGVNIVSVGSSGNLETWSGTSFSGPQVAGVCSLLAALWPNLAQGQARALVCAGAEDQVGDATDSPGFDIYYGWGRLNAWNTLQLAQTCIDSATHLPDGRALLSWPSPPNASNREPYRVQISASPAGPWALQTNTIGFGYTSQRTYWTNDSANSEATFFRVQVWQP